MILVAQQQMDIAQCSSRASTGWQHFPAVPAELERYRDLMDRFPCIDVLMVGSHSSSHYKFLRATYPRSLPCDLHTMAHACKQCVMDDPAFQGCEFVLQVWDEGRSAPLEQLRASTALVTIMSASRGRQRKVTVTYRDGV